MASELHVKGYHSQRLVFAIILTLWLFYTVAQTSLTLGILGEAVYALLSFIPGILGVSLLLSRGFSRDDCFLRGATLSKESFIILGVILVGSWAVILPFGTWEGWDWLAALVYAPASGVAQELFFRSTLLPCLLQRSAGRFRPAVLGHSFLFGLWHIGPLFLGAPLGAVFAVMAVPFICGLGWGWVVHRDRTVIWAMLQHSLILAVSNQLAFSP